MDPMFLESLIKALLALVLISGAFIVTRRDLLSLLTTYRIQSLLLVFLALALYVQQASQTLLALALLTLLGKVMFIPNFIRSIQRRMNIRRDIEFAFLTPNGSMLVTIMMILLVHYSFSRFLHELSLSGLVYMGAVFGFSLAIMGMIVTFTRRRVITKIIGYLTMENGVLVFGIFITELPLMIEAIIIIDLVILVLLATVLAIGIDSTIEDFQSRLNPFQSHREDD
jgi:hydrogenase-4 component E